MQSPERRLTTFGFIWIQTLNATNASVFCELFFFFWTELKKKPNNPTDAITTSLYNSTHTLIDSIYERFYTCGVGLLHFREL